MVEYLCKKIAATSDGTSSIHGYHDPTSNANLSNTIAFDHVYLNACVGKAMFGEKEWYFFSPRDRKYPNGSRPNRVAGSGYWKATGTDKVINSHGRKVGIKKALVFYIGKAPKGTKTNWIMHEYRLSESPRKNLSSKLDDWVLCRIYKKNSNGQKTSCDGGPSMDHSYGSSSSSSTQFSDMLETLPEIDDKSFSLPRMNSLNTFHYQENQQKLNISSSNSGDFDWTALTCGISTLPELAPPPSQTQNHMNMNNSNVNYQIGHHGTGADEEVQSRVARTHQRVDNSSGYMFNSNSFTQDFANSFDPFAIRYSVQDSNPRLLQ
ncbi:hypothetical protein Leryth_019811 [Lithospermum erythrorhizon]|nr:hypothetical protein Leryth_019811 [Lithospermum erythrorhizon]